MRRSTTLCSALAGLIGLLGIAQDAVAQPFPSRPLGLIVPFPAGGPTDTVARIMVEHMHRSLGQPIVVENLAGASASIGVGRLSRATPDGYTFGVGTWGTHVLNGATLALQYDVVNDFEPIAQFTIEPALIVGGRTMPAKDLSELIRWLKANPDRAVMSTLGPGGAQHVAGMFFQKLTGTNFRFVPYRGLGPAMQDLIAGRIDLMYGPASTFLPHVREGVVRAYAVVGRNRWAAASDIPTVVEAGLPGFDMPSWNAFFAPRGTATNVIIKLNAAVTAGLADPTIRSRLTDLGQEIPQLGQQSPQALRELQSAEIAKWWPIIKETAIKAP